MSTPERELWAAVLERAQKDYSGVNLHGYDAKPDNRARIKRGVRQWTDSSSARVGSFRWVCTALDLDPVKTRKAVLGGG